MRAWYEAGPKLGRYAKARCSPHGCDLLGIEKAIGAPGAVKRPAAGARPVAPLARGLQRVHDLPMVPVDLLVQVEHLCISRGLIPPLGR